MYLLQLLNEVPVVTQKRVVAVRNWIEASPSLNGFLEPPERIVLRFLEPKNGLSLTHLNSASGPVRLVASRPKWPRILF